MGKALQVYFGNFVGDRLLVCMPKDYQLELSLPEKE